MNPLARLVDMLEGPKRCLCYREYGGQAFKSWREKRVEIVIESVLGSKMWTCKDRVSTQRSAGDRFVGRYHQGAV